MQATFVTFPGEPQEVKFYFLINKILIQRNREDCKTFCKKSEKFFKRNPIFFA